MLKEDLIVAEARKALESTFKTIYFVSSPAINVELHMVILFRWGFAINISKANLVQQQPDGYRLSRVQPKRTGVIEYDPNKLWLFLEC